MNTTNNTGRTAEQILALAATRAARKGPKAKLTEKLDTFIAAHGERLPVADLDTAINKLVTQRNTNAQFEAEVAQAKAEVAQLEAAKAVEAAKAATAANTPTATVAA